MDNMTIGQYDMPKTLYVKHEQMIQFDILSALCPVFLELTSDLLQLVDNLMSAK